MIGEPGSHAVPTWMALHHSTGRRLNECHQWKVAGENMAVKLGLRARRSVRRVSPSCADRRPLCPHAPCGRVGHRSGLFPLLRAKRAALPAVVGAMITAGTLVRAVVHLRVGARRSDADRARGDESAAAVANDVIFDHLGQRPIIANSARAYRTCIGGFPLGRIRLRRSPSTIS